MQADPGKATLVADNGVRVRVSRVDGGAFDLFSIDFADYYGTASFGTSNKLISSSGEELGTFTVTVGFGLQTFIVGARGLQSILMIPLGSGGIGQIDNLVLDFPSSTTPVQAIPISGSLPFLVMGFLPILFFARRRRLSAKD
jgi:hypothetical protein